MAVFFRAQQNTFGMRTSCFYEASAVKLVFFLSFDNITQHPAGAAANGGAVPLDVPLSVEGEEAGSSPSQVQIAMLLQKWRKVCTCLGVWRSD